MRIDERDALQDTDTRYRDFFDKGHVVGDLRRRSIRGGAVSVIAEAIRFLIGMAATPILARLLTPADFGLIAMVAPFTRFLTNFNDLGLAMATVQRKVINHAQVSTLFWINIGLSALVTLAAMLCAPLVAMFYDRPDLTGVMILIASGFVISGVGIQHRALLRRQLQFGSLALIQIVGAAAGAVAAVIAAHYGAGYWALVIMGLATNLAGVLGAWWFCRWWPGRPSRAAGVKSMVQFGGSLTGSNIMTFLMRNLDNVLIGKVWGDVSLGLYDKAYQLLLLPIRRLNTPISGVAVPTLSRLQDDPKRYIAYFKRAILLLTAIGMPVVVFVFVEAEEVVLLMLGDQWTDAIDIFRYLAPAAFLGTMNMTTGWVFVSLGNTARQLKWSFIGPPVNLLAILIGLPWGPTGVAIAFSVSQCVLRYPGWAYCFAGTFIRIRDVHSAIWRPVLCSLLSGVVLAVTRPWFPPDAHRIVAVLLAFVVYSLSFAALWLAFPGGIATARETLSLVGELKPGGRKDA